MRVQRRGQFECRMNPLTSILSPCTRGEADGPLYQEDVRRAAGKPPLKAFRIYEMSYTHALRDKLL